MEKHDERLMDVVREIDRITKENPAIPIVIKALQEGVDVPREDRFVGLSKAAEILGTSRNYVCELVGKGQIPCWVLPGRSERKFKLSDLYLFMGSCERAN